MARKARDARGPGPAKTASLELGTSRQLELWQSADYRLRELFEADEVDALSGITFNGWVEAVNPATGIPP